MKKKYKISLVKKDIEWLRNEINELPLIFVGFSVLKQREEFAVDRDDVLELINQLDEPEVKQLYKKISELDSFNDELIRDNNQFRNTLDNQEVLSQELPVIPLFVADWIAEVKKQDKSLVFAIAHIYDKNAMGETPSEEEKRIFLWMELADNEEVFARAWLDGFTVEEEPLYRARLKVITDEFIASYLRTQSSDAGDRLKALEIGSKYIHEDYRHLSEFTEDELKRLDIWDSEQWEVEELEE